MVRRLWALYLEPYRRFSTLAGRAGRAEYWVFALVNALILWALTTVDVTLGLYSETVDLGLFGGLFSFGLLMPSIAVTVRRLHDSDLSGAWFFIVLVPLVGWIVQLIQLIRRGTRGPNRYGPDSLGEIIGDSPTDGGPPLAMPRGRFVVCPWCRQSNPKGSTKCQWCHQPYRESASPA